MPSTSALPEYRTEGSRPFEVTRVDFAGYKVGKKEEGKCYVIIFTCASSRAIQYNTIFLLILPKGFFRTNMNNIMTKTTD